MVLGPEQMRPREGEAGRLNGQLSTYLRYFYSNIELSPQSADFFLGTENVKAELESKALKQSLEIIQRNNDVASLLKSPEYQQLIDRQREQKGDCAVGVSNCVDGRIPTVHLLGWMAGVSESLAGVLPTYTSTLDGRVRLESQTLEQSIAARPSQEYSELLEIFLAHDHCGAMAKWRDEGKGFQSDDLVAENLSLFKNGVEAVTRKYNNSAVAAGRQPLQTVGIRAVYDPETMGVTVGRGEQNPLSTTDLARSLVAEFEDVHGQFAYNFTDLGKLIEKEKAVTDLIDKLYGNEGFTMAVDSALTNLDELKGLTPKQQKAFRFLIAKFTASQILTGIHEKTDHTHHPFTEHSEKYMAVTVDDGLNVNVGQYDPEEQSFAAVVSNRDQAVSHILTEVSLMDTASKATRPYVLFISNALAEDARDVVTGRPNGALKQARANVAKNFRDITEDPEIAGKIKSGEIVPIPVIITNRSRKIVEVPNLAL